MKRNILLVEDRLSRQSLQLEPRLLDRLNGMIHNTTAIGDIEQFKSVSDDILDVYDTFMYHRSFLVDNNIYNELVDYISKEENKNKSLIIFSGGITQTLYQKSPKGGDILNINSQIFYSKRMVDFVEKYIETETKPNILELAYGENYKLTYMLSYQHLLWEQESLKFIEDGEEREKKNRPIVRKMEEIERLEFGGTEYDSDTVNKKIKKLYETYKY